MSGPVGTCCVVLHTHLPWVAHAGTWPVGEEWLHQAWSSSYLPVADLLARLAAEGHRDLLTLGITPVLHAMLDDPYLLRAQHTWLGYWQTRAVELSASGRFADVAAGEHRRATRALTSFDQHWRNGGSPVLRGLADSGVVEILGGPATHPFQPLLSDRLVVDAQLGVGLDDQALRLGARPRGIWAPECGYRPGLESSYADAGVGHFLVDGPTLLASARSDALATGAGWRVGGTDVVAFGRDLDVTYRVWSPRSGYPGGRWYRDFHHYDHPTGIRPFRVTGRRVADHEKKPYDAAAAAAAVRVDAADFVDVVRRRLVDIAARRGRTGLVVVGYDTELFGHWWLEGPEWLEAVLRLLPAAGVRLSTLAGAVDAGHADDSVDLQPGSWGSGKDWRVWDGAAVRDLVEESRDAQLRLLELVDKTVAARPGQRIAALDQLAREAFLLTSSDWSFMVTKDSAAGYARSRHAAHLARFNEIAALLSARRDDAADRVAARWRSVDGPFGHLDARRLQRRNATIDAR
ncbi:MAG TPA: 1,4-alpha-glucan branching protein domain-containing protein [Mycobacteriales bacterium]|nr:1,4-alpha-glucan branching protein domain-containing protein [Mycobacteriales bacterium]